jgi:hypothetical protein
VPDHILVAIDEVILVDDFRTPWVISVVLRMFPFDSFAAAFAKRGLVTERLAGARFVQRRFRDAEEFENSLAALSAVGVKASGAAIRRTVTG